LRSVSQEVFLAALVTQSATYFFTVASLGEVVAISDGGAKPVSEVAGTDAGMTIRIEPADKASIRKR
jgi:hypothetical protein